MAKNQPKPEAEIPSPAPEAPAADEQVLPEVKLVPQPHAQEAADEQVLRAAEELALHPTLDHVIMVGDDAINVWHPTNRNDAEWYALGEKRAGRNSNIHVIARV